jgi:small-conductance mechanosensitive channel
VDEQPVEVAAPAADETIRSRISGIFSEVDGFRQIEVGVRSGVVTLSGEVPNSRTRDDALALVRRTDGVVLVQDRLTETTAVGEQLSPAFDKIRELLQALVKKLPLIGIALVTFAAFVLLANFIFRRESWFERLRLSKLAETLVRRLVRITVVGIGFVLALEVLDATAIVGAVLGAAGLVGLAIGFAFKNILENYLAGILLSTRNPFDLGDVIEIRGNTGKVAVLTARDTVLVTLDGNHLRVPNSIVINSELLNFTRNPRRRFEFLVGVSVDLDVNAARRIGLAALARHPGIVADPKPIALVDNLGDSTVNLKFLAWMDQTEHDFAKSRSEAIRLVKEAFDREGIEMPEPIYRIQLRDAGVLHADKDSAAAAKSARAAPPAEGSGEISGEDVSADDTIDRQIAEEQRDSEEENLLPPPGQEEGEKR